MAIFQKVAVRKDKWSRVTSKVPVYLINQDRSYILNQDGSRIILYYLYTRKSWNTKNVQSTKRSWSKQSVSGSKTNWG